MSFCDFFDIADYMYEDLMLAPDITLEVAAWREAAPWKANFTRRASISATCYVPIIQRGVRIQKDPQSIHIDPMLIQNPH